MPVAQSGQTTAATDHARSAGSCWYANLSPAPHPARPCLAAFVFHAEWFPYFLKNRISRKMYCKRKFASNDLHVAQFLVTIKAMEKKIGDVVRERRKALGLTLDELCTKLTDYDAGNLSRFEKGQQRIVEERLDEIAVALGTTTWELFKARNPAWPTAPAIQPAIASEATPSPWTVWPFPTSFERFSKIPTLDRMRCATYIEATVDAWEARPPMNGTNGH